ncbi:MAG: HIT family protein [Bacteroidales bacterium]|jgi:histidine triad (HIT) family protein|nr:HIT family protein [Bacteroidales bacterium]MDD2203787.1 HIT family protein [Bacteroidales bacterium]MDD3152761.1 HIT family protein [Bacteroidales bacterium]MDD3913274.1 HIT family protein [Bacteroidales bacterium]MDD4633305.1 HIT family protein [Bacteroidales bacterium]
MSSIFTKIIKGEIPCYKIAENEDCFAFLDINPLTKGHVLVVPKKEIDYLFDVDDDLYQKLFLFAKKIAVAIKKAYPCKKVAVAVIGLDVDHAHIHLVPINESADMDFTRKKLKLTQQEFETIAANIAAFI